VALGRHAGHHRLDNLAHDPRVTSGVTTGAASRRPFRRYWAPVAVEQPLVVLTGGEREHVLTVAHYDEARFLAFETVLDDDRFPALPRA